MKLWRLLLRNWTTFSRKNIWFSLHVNTDVSATFWFVLFCLFLSLFLKDRFIWTRRVSFVAIFVLIGRNGVKRKICSWMHCFVVCFIFAVAAAAASAVILLLIVVVFSFFVLLAGQGKQFEFCCSSLQTLSFLDALTDCYQHLKNRLSTL